MKFIYESDIEDNDINDLDITDDVEEITDAQIEFANSIYDLFQSIIADNNINEEFKSNYSLNNHFNKHCIGKHLDRRSTRTHIYYDFKNVNEYKEYEQFIRTKVLQSDYIISSLEDSDNILKYFHNLFMGNKSIYFTRSCGFNVEGKIINLGLYAFSSDKTDNYLGNNTVTLIILNKNDTLTMYPIDADYLETKLNNIIKKYSDLDISLKYNTEKGEE